MLFDRRYFDWLLPDAIERPTLFFFDFGDEKSMYFLCVAALVLSIIVVINVRRSRFGRVLIALRENEQNVAAFGIAAVRMQAWPPSPSPGRWPASPGRSSPTSSGASTPTASPPPPASTSSCWPSSVASAPSTAPCSAPLYFNVTRYFITSALFAGIVGSGGTLLLLYVSPGGLMSLVAKFRDACLRIVAQRRQMVVPSLFADYDPDALERRLSRWPKRRATAASAPCRPTPASASPPASTRAAGVRIFGRPDNVKEAKEAAAIGAAGKRAAEDLSYAEWGAHHDRAGDGTAAGRPPP